MKEIAVRHRCWGFLVAVLSLPAARGDEAAVDLYGDPLPPGAVARLGTVRFRFAEPYVRSDIAFLPDNKTILTSDLTALQFWDADTGKMLRELRTEREVKGSALPQRFVLAPDGRRAAVTVRIEGKPHTAHIRVLDLASGKVVQTFAREGREISGKLAFSPDGKLLLSLGSTGFFRVEEVASGKELVQKKLPLLKAGKKKSGDAGGVSISPAGDLVAFRSDGKLCLWKWAEDDLREIPGAGEVSAVAFSPDDKRLAGVTDRSGVLRVWDTANGK